MRLIQCNRCGLNDPAAANPDDSDFFEIRINQRNLDEEETFDMCLSCFRETQSWANWTKDK